MLRRNTLAENPVLLISIMFCNIMKSSRGKLRSVRTECLGHWTPLFYKACNYRPHTVAQFLVVLSVEDPYFISCKNSFVKL